MTDATQLPAWLDLNALVAPDVRDQLNAAAADFEQLAPELEQIARRAYFAVLANDDGLRDAPDDVDELVRPFTGLERLYNVCRYISDLCAVAVGDKPVAYSFDWMVK